MRLGTILLNQKKDIDGKNLRELVESSGRKTLGDVFGEHRTASALAQKCKKLLKV